MSVLLAISVLSVIILTKDTLFFDTLTGNLMTTHTFREIIVLLSLGQVSSIKL